MDQDIDCSVGVFIEEINERRQAARVLHSELKVWRAKAEALTKGCAETVFT